MVEKGPRFQMGRSTGKMIEIIEDSDFEEIEFGKGSGKTKRIQK
jgi:hypothetical protein